MPIRRLVVRRDDLGSVDAMRGRALRRSDHGTGVGELRSVVSVVGRRRQEEMPTNSGTASVLLGRSLSADDAVLV